MSSQLASPHKPFTPDASCAITDREFKTIQTFIYREAGISLSDSKRELVVSRLAKRLRELRLTDFSQYIEYLHRADPNGLERQRFINCLTTNKTEFFREPHHFDFLREVVFPEVRQRAMAGGPKQLSIWSAASSSGEEPYSIAMAILEYFGDCRDWDIQVLATDINTEVLESASTGIYPLERLQGIPDALKRKYFLKGTGASQGKCCVHPSVRELVTYRQLNLLSQPLSVQSCFDVIFCRNVIIYFDQLTQQRLLPQLARRLKPQAYLMLGHSENVPWLSDLFEPLGKTVHQLRKNPDFPVDTQANVSHQGSPGHKRHNLLAGDTFASNEAISLTTTLGSCVAACLYDPVSCVGGMNHFMLPYQTDQRDISARYGIHAMELLINQIMKLGGERGRLKAKVFGGSRVLCKEASGGVGAINVQFIRQFLALEQIPIVAEKLGSEHALRISFLPHTGQAFVKTIASSQRLCDIEKRDSEKAWNAYDRQSHNASTLF